MFFSRTARSIFLFQLLRFFFQLAQVFFRLFNICLQLSQFLRFVRLLLTGIFGLFVFTGDDLRRITFGFRYFGSALRFDVGDGLGFVVARLCDIGSRFLPRFLHGFCCLFLRRSYFFQGFFICFRHFFGVLAAFVFGILSRLRHFSGSLGAGIGHFFPRAILRIGHFLGKCGFFIIGLFFGKRDGFYRLLFGGGYFFCRRFAGGSHHIGSILFRFC